MTVTCAGRPSRSRSKNSRHSSELLSTCTSSMSMTKPSGICEEIRLPNAFASSVGADEENASSSKTPRSRLNLFSREAENHAGHTQHVRLKIGQLDPNSGKLSVIRKIRQ